MPQDQNYKNKIARILDEDSTFIKSWRPAIAYMYIAICLFDFIIGPVFWSLIQIYGAGVVSVQWVPLTVAEGGLFHMAIGAILGAAAFTRGQEKVQRLKSVTNINYQPPENPYRLPEDEGL